MSDPRAIAAVTATLRRLLSRGIQLDDELGDIIVTTLPLDKARDGAATANQLNLFLYQAMPNAAWRNQGIPQQGKAGEIAAPPLALNLHYLLTAFGQDNDTQQPRSHEVLGRAMSVLHDHPLLGGAEIGTAFADSDLSNQVERLRVTLQPLPVDDIFRLWSGFQTQYRLSVAYEVSVVLIDSRRPARASLPVLTRGEADAGVIARPDLVPPYPTITALLPPSAQEAALPGDVLTVQGHHLDGETVRVLLNHRLFDEPKALLPAAGATAVELRVALPAADAGWPAGPYQASVEVTTRAPGPTPRPIVRSSAEAPFAIAPSIDDATVEATIGADGRATLRLGCTPSVWPAQRACLLLAMQEFVAAPLTQKSRDLRVEVTGVPAGTYPVRLRVQGVDSLLVDRSVRPPVFKKQAVVLKEGP